jgi:hypothetical protein
VLSTRPKEQDFSHPAIVTNDEIRIGCGLLWPDLNYHSKQQPRPPEILLLPFYTCNKTNAVYYVTINLCATNWVAGCFGVPIPFSIAVIS